MSASPTTVEKVHITRTPGVCGGKACVAGHRIRVLDVYLWHELQGHSPDEIVADFPQITLADVYAALAYFWDHRDEILNDLKLERDVADEAGRAFPSKLPSKLKGQDGPSVSS